MADRAVVTRAALSYFQPDAIPVRGAGPEVVQAEAASHSASKQEWSRTRMKIPVYVERPGVAPGRGGRLI
jgi:hypothetical protein